MWGRGGAGEGLVMGARVDAVMSSPVLTTTAGTRAVDAALAVALGDVTALPVLRDGEVVGMFCAEDLLASSSSRPQSALTVGEVMGPVPLTTTPDADRERLGAVMAQRGVTSVPVLDRGRLVGIITRRDLAKTATGCREPEPPEPRATVSPEPPEPRATVSPEPP
jgi:CBS domain-containing protein